MKRALWLLFPALLLATPVFSQQLEKHLAPPVALEGARTATTGSCSTGNAESELNINNVRARIFNNGNLFWSGSPNIYTVPQTDGINALFAASLWMGGMVGSELRVAGSIYGPFEFWPGPLNPDGTLPDPLDCSPYDRIYQITLTDIQTYDDTGIASPDLMDWPWDLGAPVVDGDGVPDNYNLAGGDRPELIGHQMLWWVMNDLGNTHDRTGGTPLKMEVQVTAFSANDASDTDVDNATLYRYKLIYRGEAQLDDFYLGLFLDPDLGDFSDDYVGSDPGRNLGYVYNADDDDVGGYGLAPPALGVDIIQGFLADTDGLDNDDDGLTDEAGERTDLYAMISYNNGGSVQGSPNTDVEYYQYLQAEWRDGLGMTYGGDGRNFSATRAFHMYPDDPVTGSFWTERNTDDAGTANAPADRSFVISTGPISMQPGDMQEVAFSIVWDRGADYLDAITEMLNAADAVQSQFDAGFNITPPSPPTEVPTLLAPADGTAGQPRNLDMYWMATSDAEAYQLLVATDPAFANVVASPSVMAPDYMFPTDGLDPFTTYFWRVQGTNAGGGSPWSETWSFTTSDVNLLPPANSFTNFEAIANAAGDLTPHESAAAQFAGYPVASDPTTNQQVGDGLWMIHTGGNRSTYTEFLDRVTRNGGNNEAIGNHDYEWRFTGTSKAYRAFQDGLSFDVPFELWDIGPTPDDPSDDVRLIPWALEGFGGGTTELVFDLGDDSPISGEDNDPYTDWIYAVRPVDDSPGETGYDAYVEAVENGTYGFEGTEVMARLVLVNWNGGSTPPYNQDLPETGTIFRISTSKEAFQAPILAAPFSGAMGLPVPPMLYWNRPGGLDTQLQVALDPSLTTPIVDEVGLTGTMFEALTLDERTTYYWRARSTRGTSLPSEWSETWQFTTGPTDVLLTSPNGGEVWPTGVTRTITWTDELAGNVRLLLFKGGLLERTITGSTPSDGAYDYPVPADLVPGSDYSVRIRDVADAAIADDSDLPFTVDDSPYIGVLTPNGGESWPFDTMQTITWEDNLLGDVRILLFKNGAFEQTIVGATPSDGSYDWTVPGGLPPGADYSVRIRDVADAAISDDSDGVFTIGPPVSFTVDLEQMTLLGLFDAGRGDQIQVRGSFNGWVCEPGQDCLLAPGGSTLPAERYTGTFAMPNTVGEEVAYKFYLEQNIGQPPSGWEEPLDVGSANRTFIVESTAGQALEVDLFNDVRSGNVIPAGTDVDVTFQVNMAPAQSFTTRPPFDPVTDAVEAILEDPLWIEAYLANGGTLPILLTDGDADMIYEGAVTITGPIYNGVGFRYGYIKPVEGLILEGESGIVEPGRRRYHYIPDMGAGHDRLTPALWPAAYSFPVVDVQEFNPLPFEDNPTAMPGPFVEMTTPNGGESWTAGTTETLTWTDNLAEDVRLILFKNGVFDRTIIAATPSDGSFDYAVPAALAPGADYTVRIRSVDDAGISDDADAPFSVEESIVVTSPPPGAMWAAGTTQDITWTSNIPDAVRILLFKGGVFSQTIEVSTANDGFVFFAIPTTLATGSDYTIRVRKVTDAAVSGNSDPFEIVAGDALTVVSPNGGEVWQKGTTQEITWTDNFTENVRLMLFKGGSFNRNIVGSTPSDGSYMWTPPAPLTPGSDYTIRIRKADNYLVRDDSDASFEITPSMPAPVLVGAARKAGTPIAKGLLQWQPVEGAEGYRIEIAADTAFAEVLMSATLSGETTTYDATTALEDALAIVEAGRTYAVRLRAEAGEQYSAWTEASLTTEAPQSFTLEANYPNPFNPTTTIRYALKEASKVRLSIFDVLGREVAVLVDGPQAAGRYQLRFVATNLPSGVYFYRLNAQTPEGAFEQVRPMLLAK